MQCSPVSWPLYRDAYRIVTFLAIHSSSKDIDKSPCDINGSTVVLWSYENTFLCAKKTKIMTLFNNFFCSLSVFDARSWEYHNTCVHLPLLASKAQHIQVLPAPVSAAPHIHCGIVVEVRQRKTRKISWWIKSLFLFSFDCFNNVLCRVRKLSDFIKNMLICVPKMNEVLTGLERHEGE